MRAKWSAPIRKYWKISEQMMVKYCDLAICDSVNIEKYIHECYDGKGIKGSSPKTTFIAYGADLTLSKLADDDEKLVSWYKKKGLTKKGYYLVVGRFVPENSFEVMIREFMKSKSKKEFINMIQRDKLLDKYLEHIGHALEDTGRTHTVRAKTTLECGTHLTFEINVEERQQRIGKQKHNAYEHTLYHGSHPGGAPSVKPLIEPIGSFR